MAGDSGRTPRASAPQPFARTHFRQFWEGSPLGSREGDEPVFLGFAFFAFTLGFSAFAWLEARTERNFSVTGVVAGMLAFALGAYAVVGEVRIAIAVAVAVTLILALNSHFTPGFERSAGSRSVPR